MRNIKIFSDKQNLMLKKFPWLKKMIPVGPQVSTREWREPEMVYMWESLQDFCFSGFLIFSKNNNYLKESQQCFLWLISPMEMKYMTAVERKGTTSRSSHSVGISWGLRLYIFYKCSGNVNAPCQGPVFKNHWLIDLIHFEYKSQ